MTTEAVSGGDGSTILTLELDPASTSFFEGLRREHYPPALNRIGAHLTLFHTLPVSEEVRKVLSRAAAAQAKFPLEVTGLRSLGRGTAFVLASGVLPAMHRSLAAEFAAHLSAQDRQKFQPHVVVQNKVSGDEARSLRVQLEAEFAPRRVMATGLLWWDYLGGPWALRERFPFGS